jgi:hypothetical protein
MIYEARLKVITIECRNGELAFYLLSPDGQFILLRDERELRGENKVASLRAVPLSPPEEEPFARAA